MRRIVLVAALTMASLLVSAGGVAAQTATPVPTSTVAPAPQGTISGTVVNGTAGMTSADDVEVQLLALDQGGAVTSEEGVVADGRFSFTPPASSTVTYILRATYQGVSYLVEPPILLSPEVPSDQREITVYETTSDVPAELRVDSTVLSLQGLDRAQAQLTLQREDQVLNPTDRVYVGGDDRVSLRIPAPEGVLALLDAESIEGESALDGGIATTTQPLKPGVNLIVTRYLVGYDRAADEYRMRVTAALPTEHMEIWVPERFVGDIELGAEATRADDEQLQGERWNVITRNGAAGEGEGLTATVEGLSNANTANPLTQFPGAAIAVAVALGALLAGVVLLGRVRLSWGGEAAGCSDLVTAIEARALTKRYGVATILDRVSFEVAAGTKTALVGPNGAGKSTLLAVLSTLVIASEGTATVAGCDLRRDGADVRRHIGVLSHSPMLYEELTPLENLQFFARLYDVPSPAGRIEELLRVLGLWRRRDEPTAVFSRGYHQRLAIGRALVHDPDVLLLDEPETGLDAQGMKLLDALMLREPRLTVLAATHRFDHIDAWADATLTIERGRIAQPAAPMESARPALRAVQ